MPLDTLSLRKPIAAGQLLIGGAWRDAADGATMTTFDPTTEAVITSVAKASAVDAAAAVDAAPRAFEDGPWPRMHHEDRAKIVLHMADLMDERADDFAIREAVDIPFDTEEEAVRLANDTPYGLASGIQSAELGRGLRLGARIGAETVWINTWHKYHPNAPFGGFEMSGYGREQGAEALEIYTQYKTVWANLGSA